jgi:hypothetical protein
MEPKGDEGSIVLFHIHQKNTLGINSKEAYELWREGTPITRINIDVKLLLNQKNCILKAKRITVEIDKIKENIKLKIQNDTEDHTQGMNDNKMDMNDKEHQKRDMKVTILA